MFGRLKIALVALVLMPAAAYAADHKPMHSPGPAAVAETDAGTKKVVLTAGTGEGGHKHHSSAKSVLAGPSPLELFLRHLRGADHAPGVVASIAGKQAAVAISGPALPGRTAEHRPA